MTRLFVAATTSRSSREAEMISDNRLIGHALMAYAKLNEDIAEMSPDPDLFEQEAMRCRKLAQHFYTLADKEDK
jgi:hypothetical protein